MLHPTFNLYLVIVCIYIYIYLYLYLSISIYIYISISLSLSLSLSIHLSIHPSIHLSIYLSIPLRPSLRIPSPCHLGPSRWLLPAWHSYCPAVRRHPWGPYRNLTIKALYIPRYQEKKALQKPIIIYNYHHYIWFLFDLSLIRALGSNLSYLHAISCPRSSSSGLCTSPRFSTRRSRCGRCPDPKGQGQGDVVTFLSNLGWTEMKWVKKNWSFNILQIAYHK